MGASKNDTLDNKPDYSLIPKVFMDQLAYALMAGANKYGRYNYTKGHNLCQLIAASERHLKVLQSGEDIDGDCSERVNTEVHHAANVAANMLMLLHQRELGTLKDDRFRPKEAKLEAMFDECREMNDVAIATIRGPLDAE